jgi:hypothetical protein
MEGGPYWLAGSRQCQISKFKVQIKLKFQGPNVKYFGIKSFVIQLTFGF